MGGYALRGGPETLKARHPNGQGTRLYGTNRNKDGTNLQGLTTRWGFKVEGHDAFCLSRQSFCRHAPHTSPSGDSFQQP